MKKNIINNFKRSLLIMLSMITIVGTINGYRVFAEEEQENRASSVENALVVSDMNDLKLKIESATEDTTILLDSNFEVNLDQTYDINIPTANTANITVDGNNLVISAKTDSKHLIIHNNGTGTLAFKNITFSGNVSQSGNANKDGGINFYFGSYSFDNVTFKHSNRAVDLDKVGSFIVRNSTFINNYNPGSASAINAESGVDNLEVYNSSFVGNTGDGYGRSSGAIWVKAPKVVTIENSFFKENVSMASGGGGAIAFTVATENTINIRNSYFEANSTDYPVAGGSAWADGGAIYYYGAPTSESPYFNVEDCTFVENIAHDDGGAIEIEAPGENGVSKVVNSTFVGNHAYGKGSQGYQDNSGGAIQVSINTTVDLIHNTFYNNSAGGEGSLISAQQGGAIATHNEGGREATINLTNNILSGNYVSAPNGSVIDSDYSNVSATNVNNENNLGVDNGTPLDPSLTPESIFGVDAPKLASNSDTTFIGNTNDSNNIAYLPTLMILIHGEASQKGIQSSTISDARGFSRTLTPDLGALEIGSINFDANGGSWVNLPPLVYTGEEYYDSTEPTNFYKISHNDGMVNALDDSNLKNGSKVLQGWSNTADGDVIHEIGSVQPIFGNRTVYAVWADAINYYTVTYTDGVDGTVFADESKSVKEGDATPSYSKEILRSGYTFEGWSPVPSELVTKDVTYIAQWKKIAPTDPVTPVDPTLPATGVSNDSMGILTIVLGGLILSLGMVIDKKKRLNIK